MFDDLINRSTHASEQDFRLMILNALLRTPHRKMQPYISLFSYVHERDPLFFGHLAAWYYAHGSGRDLKQLFTAFMATSKFSDEYRSAGLAMLQQLPPFEVERVLGLIKGHDEEGTFVKGIAPTVPRSVKTTIEAYLREREADPAAFDNVVLHARKPLKTLYASLRIKPSEYAQRVLFDNDPPVQSRLHVLKELAKIQDPSVQAGIIWEHKIPYRIAVSLLKEITPDVLRALISNMSAQEVINNLGSLKKRGAMNNNELRELVEKKLESAKTDKRVSALKTRAALEAAGVDEQLAQKVRDVGDAQVKTKARITKPTALLVDKSGSMEVAIEAGKQLAAVIAPVCEDNLFVYAFDTMAYHIQAKGTNLSDWEKAFKGINAGGGTSCGVAIEVMRKQKQLVEQIIIVTDEQENTAPYMAEALLEYEKQFGVLPSVNIVTVGMFNHHLEQVLSVSGITVDVFNFTGDYYSLPSLLPMLAGGTRLELLMEIMAYQLPQRKPKQLAVAGLNRT